MHGKSPMRQGHYRIETDYANLANAKAAAFALVSSYWDSVFGVQINGEPYYKRRIRPNGRGLYIVTARTTRRTHPLDTQECLQPIAPEREGRNVTK
jgi:hypothetical protein